MLFHLKIILIQATFVLVILFALTSCSENNDQTTKNGNSSADDVTSEKKDDQERESPATPEESGGEGTHERGSAKEAGTDEPTSLETLSYDAEASTFVFYDKSISLKPGARSKIVTLRFTGGFAEDRDGKVKTTGTVYQGPKCNDKHGNDVHPDLFETPFTDLYKYVNTGAGGKGISECYKQVAVTDVEGSTQGDSPRDLYRVGTEPANKPTRQTIIMVSRPVENATKNHDAGLENCQAVLAGPQTGNLELKAKIMVANEGQRKLKIQFWDESGIPNREATSERGLAKIKRALGLKTYSKNQVKELLALTYSTNKTRGAESSPLASSEGDCFKYLYARQLGVNYELTRVNDSPNRYIPRSQIPSGATIAAHKTLQPKSQSDARPSENFHSGPQVVVTHADESFVIGTKALDQLLQSISSSLNFAGASTSNDLITAMDTLAEKLEMKADP